MIDLIALSTSAQGLLILFLWVYSSSLGIPLGALFAIMSFGALASTPQELGIVMVTVFLATVLGDLTAYGLARYFSGRIMKKIKTYRFMEKNEALARKMLERYEIKIIFFTRFALTGLCSIVSYLSGLQKINKKKFLLAVILGEGIYTIIYPLIGFFFKETWNELIQIISNGFIIIALILLAGIIIKKRLKARKKQVA